MTPLWLLAIWLLVLNGSTADSVNNANKTAVKLPTDGDRDTKVFLENTYSFWRHFPNSSKELQEQEKPFDVSGTYRGSWEQVLRGEGFSSKLLPIKPEGIIFFQLNQVPGSVNDTVHTIEGDVVLRDGTDFTDNDVRMHLDGVYVQASGRLHLLLKPRLAVYQRADPVQYQEMKDTNSQEYRHSLRAMARAWLFRPRGMATPMLREGQPLPLLRLCTFRMEMLVAVPPAGTPGPATMPTQELEEASLLGSAKRRLLGSLRQLRRAPEELMLDGASPSPGVLSPTGVNTTGLSLHRDRSAAQVDISAAGVVFNDNCNFSLSFNASSFRLDSHYTKAVRYSLMATAGSVAQILLTMRQMDHSATQSSAAKVALWTLGQQALMDAYLCLLHLTAALVVDALFNAFATTAFFQFLLFAMFEMRFILMVWRAQRPNSGADVWTGRRELGTLYTKFYAVLLAGIFLSYQLQNYLQVLVFLFFSFWVPQIIHSAVTEARQPLLPSYILGTSAQRLLLPLYLYGCPNNVLNTSSQQPLLLGSLLVWVAAQVVVLLLQHHFGPRCFIPRMLLPARYDYFRAATTRELGLAAGEIASSTDVETGHGSVECMICISPVEHLRPGARCVTPCGHFFHSACLQRWMDVKMECPTCRRALPPL